MGLVTDLPIRWSHGHICCKPSPTSTHVALILGIFVLYIPLSAPLRRFRSAHEKVEIINYAFLIACANICVNLKFSCSQGLLVFTCTWKCGRRSRGTHTMRARTCVSVVVFIARKLRPCPSYSRRRDRNNSVHWRSLYKGGAGYIIYIGQHRECNHSPQTT